MKQYVQTDLEADRQVANTLAELIIGGSLASTAVGPLANPLANHMLEALSLFEKGPLALVAGAGFERDLWVMSHTTCVSGVSGSLSRA
jgi:hypothetical protein